MIRPSFLHIGASKSASSWLWRVLQGHPEIYVPTRDGQDNPNFYTVHYQRGYEWYAAEYFSDYSSEPVVGEFSNSYMLHEPAMQRIARDLPDVKLVMTLRHPVERAYLQWAHITYKKRPGRNVEMPMEFSLQPHGHAWFRLWIEPGMYSFHLKRLSQYFPRERMNITLYDDLASKQAEYLRDYYAFLGVDADYVSPLIGKQVNPDHVKTDIKRDLDPAFVSELQQVYDPYISELEDLIDRDLSAWRKL